MVDRPHPPIESEVTHVDFRAVAKVAQQARLIDIRLSWSQLGRFTAFDAIESEWAAKAFVFFSSEAALDGEEEPVTSPLTVQCVFFLHCFDGIDSREVDTAPEASDDNPPSVAVEAMFDLVYELDDPAGIDHIDVHNFALANGTHNAWPYWREFAQSATLRLGLTPYIAPPFKLPSADDPARSADAPPDGEEETSA